MPETTKIWVVQWTNNAQENVRKWKKYVLSYRNIICKAKTNWTDH